jgi:hypothetical protein
MHVARQSERGEYFKTIVVGVGFDIVFWQSRDE